MTKSEKQLWKQERAKGYDHFLLQHGLLKAGLPFGVIFAAASILVSVFWHHSIPSLGELLIRLGAATLLYGFLIGTRTWRNNEVDYKESIEIEDDDAA